jgi:hypothetical protein
MTTMKEKYSANNSIRYCPDWTAPNKAERPKKGARRKSALEVAHGKGKKKHKTLFCTICSKYNHTTANCYDEEDQNGGGGRRDNY